MNARTLLMSAAALTAACETKSSTSAPAPTAPTAPTVSPVEGGADPQTGAVRYLAMGDSLTQGIGATDPEKGSFPALLADAWRARGCTVELKNVAVAGYTSNDVLVNEVPEIAPFKPTFISLAVGTNDVAQNVPLETYRKNVAMILDATKKSGARVVVLPQNEWFRSPEGPNYGTGLAEKRAAFDSALIEETKAAGAELVDLRLLFQQQADKKQWASDNLHPSGEAYAAWAAELARVVPSPCGK